jgi:hypothetical protein
MSRLAVSATVYQRARDFINIYKKFPRVGSLPDAGQITSAKLEAAHRLANKPLKDDNFNYL